MFSQAGTGGRSKKKKRLFPEEQIVNALRQAEAGTPAAEVCPPSRGSAEQTFYRWKRQFAGRGVVELRRLLRHPQCDGFPKVVRDTWSAHSGNGLCHAPGVLQHALSGIP